MHRGWFASGLCSDSVQRRSVCYKGLDSDISAFNVHYNTHSHTQRCQETGDFQEL